MQNDMKAAASGLGLWGVLSVIFGVLILAWPGITVKVFLIILGIYLLSVGVVMLVGSLMNREGRWVGHALIGVLSVVAGMYVFAHPQSSALALLSVIAIWSIAVGMLNIVAGFEGKNNWLMIFAGTVYTLFGFYIFANPKGGAITLIWLIGLTTIAAGISLVIAAVEANSLSKQLPAKR